MLGTWQVDPHTRPLVEEGREEGGQRAAPRPITTTDGRGARIGVR